MSLRCVVSALQLQTRSCIANPAASQLLRDDAAERAVHSSWLMSACRTQERARYFMLAACALHALEAVYFFGSSRWHGLSWRKCLYANLLPGLAKMRQPGSDKHAKS